MRVTHVNGKSYEVVTIKGDDPHTRCKNCAFNHDDDACIVAGAGCFPNKVERGVAGYFVPVLEPVLEPDEQCGVGNG